MPSQDLTLTLAYGGEDNAAVVQSQDQPVTSSWGLKDEGSAIGVAECTARLDNNEGAYSPDDVRSPLYGLIGLNTPATVMVGPEVLADGVVAGWAPDTLIRGNAWTDIRIAGPSERVNASPTVLSCLRGTFGQALPGVAGYWPMEGHAFQPDRVANLVPGGPSATHRFYTTGLTAAFDWVGEQTLPGSSNLPVLESNRTAIAGIEANALISPDPSLGGAFWSRTYTPKTDASHGVTSTTVSTYRLDYGYALRISLVTNPPGSVNATVPADGEVLLQADWIDPDLNIVDSVLVTDLEYLDQWRHVYASFVTSASDVDVELFLDGVSVGSGTLTAATLADVTRATINVFMSDSLTEESARTAVGHHMFMSASATVMDDLAALQYQAGLGFPGELAGYRFGRLCDEHAVANSVYGDVGATRAMGPQVPDTLTNLITECARTDGGLVYDARQFYELEFRTGESLANQVPALVLTYGVNVAPPVKPVTDGLGVANDVTATSRTGSFARAERTSGPLNVSDPVDDPDGIGRKEAKLEVNPATDGDLDDLAGWALHEATYPGPRYASITVDLGEHPDLIPDVMAMHPGDVIAVDDLSADRVELMALGAVDLVESHARWITFNCKPAGPFATPTAGLTDLDRLAAAASRLAADFNVGVDTSMSVESDAALWTTAAADLPLHIRVGGAVLNVTNITGATSPQTFTVDATALNGVTRQILATDGDALTRVDIEYPLYVGG